MNKILNFAVSMVVSLFILIPCSIHAQDQTVNGNLFVADAFTAGTNSTSAQLQFRLNGTILGTGSYVSSGGGLLSSDSSLSGPVFLWYPTKAALWAGYASSGSITDSNIGDYSISLGYENTASNSWSVSIGTSNVNTALETVAMGDGNSVTSLLGTAIGSNEVVSGSSGVAIGGNGTASGTRSVSIGQGWAPGTYAVAIGFGGAQGNYSFAAGESHAAGQYSAALGASGAYGDYSFSAGSNVTTGATYSCAMGYNLYNLAYNEVAFGSYNIGISNGNDSFVWSATDPLFELGNGTSSTATSDALVVYKNGNTWIYGSDNELPHQTLVGTNSILTRGLADGRYAPLGSGSTTSFSVLPGAVATGTDSVALGSNANASGNYSYALGNADLAVGTSSSAFGANTTATSYDSVVFGRYNSDVNSTGGTPSTTTWTAADPLFELGDGTSTSPADALVIYKNGNAVVQGNLTTGGSISTTAGITTASLTSSGAITAASVSTTGGTSTATLTTTGAVSAGGTVTAPAFITTTQTGDIPMFTGN